jgi:hypothetical protein
MLECLPANSIEASWFVVERYSGVELADQAHNLLGRGKSHILEGSGISAVLVSILAAQDGVSVRVVPCSLLRVGQDLVSGLYFSETTCSIFDIMVVAIGMKFESFSAISFLDPV